MRYLLIILGLLFWSCDDDSTEEECEWYDFPPPPYGDDFDDFSTYEGSDCYFTVTYRYYCEDGRYRSFTYSKGHNDCCSNLHDPWETSEFTSDCILLSNDGTNDLLNMDEKEREEYYKKIEKIY